MEFRFGSFQHITRRQLVLTVLRAIFLVMHREPHDTGLVTHIFHNVDLTVEQIVVGMGDRKHPERGPYAPARRKLGPHLEFAIGPRLSAAHTGRDILLAADWRFRFVSRDGQHSVADLSHGIVPVYAVDVILFLVVAPARTAGLEPPFLTRLGILRPGCRLLVELLGPDQTVFAVAFLVLFAINPPVGFLEIGWVILHAARRRSHAQQTYHPNHLFHRFRSLSVIFSR